MRDDDESIECGVEGFAYSFKSFPPQEQRSSIDGRVCAQSARHPLKQAKQSIPQNIQTPPIEMWMLL